MEHTTRLRYPLLVLVGFFALATDASAGWVSIKNDTKAAVLVQEAPASPTAKRGKPVRLLPGEVYREYHAVAGEKTIQVLDAKSPTRVLCEAKVKWPAEDVAVRVRTFGATTKLDAVADAKPGSAEAVVTAVAKSP